MVTPSLRRLPVHVLTLALPLGLLASTSCHGHAGHGDSGEHAGQDHAAHDVSDPGSESERPNTLTDEQREAGWVLLFDGRTTAGWRGFKTAEMPAALLAFH